MLQGFSKGEQVDMKVTAWTGPEDPTLRLRLIEEYGRIWLYGVDENGVALQKGRILCIDPDGTIRRATNPLDNTLPLQTDEQGRVVIS